MHLVLALLLPIFAIADEPRFWRTGWELGLTLGAAAQTGGETLGIRTTGGTLTAESRGTGFFFAPRFAYRPIPWVAPYFDVGLGLPSKGRYFAGGFGIATYPVHLGRIDPRIDLGATYTQWNSSELALAGDVIDASATLHGVAFHLGAAAPVFVLPWLSIGPSFRYDFAFWQSVCSSVSDCIEVSKINQVNPGFKDALPSLWSFGVDVVFHPSDPRRAQRHAR